jgi:hypothetical protein
MPNYSEIYLPSFLSIMARLSWTSLDIIFLSRNFFNFLGSFPSNKELVALTASLVSLNLEKASNLTNF